METSDIGSILERCWETYTWEDLRTLLQMPWQALAPAAKEVVDEHKGDHVFVRGLLEFSNICRRNCHYCGLRAQNKQVKRYLLGEDAIFAAAMEAKEAGVDTIVLQSGEGACDAHWLAEVVRELKRSICLPITLSVGEHNASDYALWRECGADRFLLKHETSDQRLYAALHPGYRWEHRIRCYAMLRDLDYEVGGGFMIGLPGQTLESLAWDILLCRDQGFAMVGAGPFLPQAHTPLAHLAPGTLEMTLRVTAALRLALPWANLPATTALATLDPATGQHHGLMAGANVLMPSFTPPAQASQYTIYDHKNRVSIADAANTIESVGRRHSLRCRAAL